MIWELFGSHPVQCVRKYLELKLGENHAAGSDTVDINLLVPVQSVLILFSTLSHIPLESKDVKSFVHDLHLLLVVNGVNLDLSKAAGRIICEQNIR